MATLTSQIKTSVRDTIQRRRVLEDFIARGLRSSEDAKRTAIYRSAESVLPSCSSVWRAAQVGLG